MSNKRDKNARAKETSAQKHAKVTAAVKSENKKQQTTYVMSDEQEAHLDDIQRITQEEFQRVLDNLEDYKDLTEKQIHGKVTIRVRERCKEELGMILGH